MKKITFVYTRGRKDRFLKYKKGDQVPKEFFYGLTEFEELGFQTSFFEQDAISVRPPFFKNFYLSIISYIFAKYVNIAFAVPQCFGLISNLNKNNVTIGIPDSVGLALSYYKKRKWLNSKLIFFGMGLSSRLWLFKKQKRLLYGAVKRFCYSILTYADGICLLGEAEAEFLKKEMPKLKDKIFFIPFGVDTGFWRPEKKKKRNRSILFVGNDPNRDFSFVMDLARVLFEFDFIIVSSKVSFENLPQNVKLTSGTWNKSTLSDEDLRELYRTCGVVILPIKETIQPSGQSVTLQALSCGAPVLISEYEGFWEKSAFAHNKEIVFIKNHTLDSWVSEIKRVLSDDRLTQQLSENGRKLVEERYSLDIFSKKLKNIIQQI